MTDTEFEHLATAQANKYVQDWCLFAKDVFGITLDSEQEQILKAFQFNKKVSVCSGTGRGKDFIAAVAALCFLYLTPQWDSEGTLTGNTKVALTAPSQRQIENIMFPEVSRLFSAAERNGFRLPGKLLTTDIRTENKEWFLTGFKADDNNTEAWTGLHAVNTAFIVTEASGITDTIWNAIEGNLQGNSRLLIVFNNNNGIGYAANSQRSPGWKSFRLDSLNAVNVVQRKIVIPGQVDFDWISTCVKTNCLQINESDFLESEGDFYWTDENGFKACYRPDDFFRVKVRGMAPKVSNDTLIPAEWIYLANKRWIEQSKNKNIAKDKNLRLGVDVAGMGRDSSVFCPRFDDFVKPFISIKSAGVANHMEIVGKTVNILSQHTDNRNYFSWAFIDTIGEGAGVYSRLEELNIQGVHSVKASNKAEDRNGKPLTDITGQRHFVNMRAFLYWCVRDWLNPVNKTNAALPEDPELLQELTETKYNVRSDGKIIIEPKEDIKVRLKRSPDKSDALANTFALVHNSNKNNLNVLFGALP